MPVYITRLLRWQTEAAMPVYMEIKLMVTSINHHNHHRVPLCNCAILHICNCVTRQMNQREDAKSQATRQTIQGFPKCIG